MTLYLIRHGATAGNAEKRYIGSTDESLSAAGRNELLRLQSENRYPASDFMAADMLFSSPMKRCLETAAVLFGERQPVIIDQFREMNFGLFEGMNYRELNGDTRYQAWIDSGGTLAFPGGEDRDTFINRCVQGLQKLYGIVAADCTAVAVVHGGTIMALLSACAGGDYWSYQTENGLGWKMQVTEADGNLLCTNVEKL